MKNVAAAIDFGTSKLVTIVAENGRYHRCDIIGAGLVPYDGYKDGYWNVPEQVTQKIEESIRMAEQQSSQTIRELNIGVPGEFCRVYAAEVSLQLQGVEPQVTPGDVDQIFDLAEKEIQPVRGVIIHRSPAWFIIDDGNKVMEPVGMKGSTLRTFVSFIVADAFFINDMNRRMHDLRLDVGGFYSSPMGESVLFLPPEDRDRTAILLDVGYLNTEIMAVEGDALVFHKVIGMGGAHITRDLIYGLEVKMSVAEEIKRNYVFGMADGSDVEAVGPGGRVVSFPREKVSEIIEARVDEIADEIREAIDHSGVRLGSWSNIYLTGGGLAMMRGGREYLSARMERPIRQPQPKAATLNSPIYASAMGLIDLVIEMVSKDDEGGNIIDRLSGIFKRK